MPAPVGRPERNIAVGLQCVCTEVGFEYIARKFGRVPLAVAGRTGSIVARPMADHFCTARRYILNPKADHKVRIGVEAGC